MFCAEILNTNTRETEHPADVLKNNLDHNAFHFLHLPHSLPSPALNICFSLVRGSERFRSGIKTISKAFFPFRSPHPWAFRVNWTPKLTAVSNCPVDFTHQLFPGRTIAAAVSDYCELKACPFQGCLQELRETILQVPQDFLLCFLQETSKEDLWSQEFSMLRSYMYGLDRVEGGPNILGEICL